MEMAQTYDLALLSTFFKKKEKYLSTFKSRRNRSVTKLYEFPIEIMKGLWQTYVALMTTALMDVLTHRIQSEWRKSKITPFYKQKGDTLNYCKYKCIKLLNHYLKLLERVIDARLET